MQSLDADVGGGDGTYSFFIRVEEDWMGEESSRRSLPRPKGEKEKRENFTPFHHTGKRVRKEGGLLSIGLVEKRD